MSVGDWIASLLLLTGTGFALLGAIGLQRFPDVFARMHAATKPVTLGLAFALLGAALVKEDFPSAVKLLLAAALQFITAPVGAHMIGRAAYRDGNQFGPDYQVDELAGVFEASTGGQAGKA
jgi:multicomponent Na+:H+ antiporter subunit G